MSWLATREESSPLKMALTVPRWVQVPRWPKVGAHRCRNCTSSQLSSSATVQPGTVQLSGTAPRLQVQNLQLKKRKTLWASVETRVWYNRVLNPKMWIVWPILPFSALYPLSSWPHSRHVTQPQHPLWQPCLTFILHFHSKWKENRGHTICTRIFNI